MQEEISFGTWLRKQRRALDLSQKALADQVGCAEVTLRRIEAGRLKPSKELANLLLEKLGIPETERTQWVAFARGLTGIPLSSIPSSSKPKTNLPTPLTTFIGRQKEQSDVIGLINKHRLVTLTGPGGVGKTRLSIKVGEQVLGNYADGVWLVELASLNNPALIAQTFAALFGLTAQSTIPFTDLLINFLRAKSVLLIVDNCEHLLDACAHLIDTFLKSCPHLKILATSREPLGITGEAIYLVPSLELPDVQQLINTFRDFESVRLFEERAQLTQFDFSLTLENAASVAQICQRLDGIPLAIELAAAKVAVLSTEQIANQLHEGFNLLAEGSRTALPRHQTLRASINWSWNLLTEWEQRLMRQLSVFAGGWTLEAAQSVCNVDVLMLLNSLVTKSLIMMDQRAETSARYSFHETIRQYAREKLIESREEEHIRGQHLKYSLQFSEQAEAALKGPMQMDWYARLHAERDNIRVALDWADKTNVEAGMYICGNLGPYWDKFDFSEGLRWLTKFSQKPESLAYPHARAAVLCQLAWSLQWMEQFDQAHVVAEECLDLYRTCGDKHGEVDALTVLGNISSWKTRSDLKLLQQALAQAQLLRDRWRQAQILGKMGGLVSSYPERVSYWENAITLFQEVGDFFMACGFMIFLANIEMAWGHFESARLKLNEALRLSQEKALGQEKDFYFLNIAGRISSIDGDFKEARLYQQAAINISEDQGHRMNILWSRTDLGFLALREGNVNEAYDFLAETAPAFQKDNNLLAAAFTLEGLARYYVTINKPNKAARLVGWADAARKKSGDLRPPVEQADVEKVVATCIAKMGNVAYANAYDEGGKLTLDEAVTFALRES